MIDESNILETRRVVGGVRVNTATSTLVAVEPEWFRDEDQEAITRNIYVTRSGQFFHVLRVVRATRGKDGQQLTSSGMDVWLCSSEEARDFIIKGEMEIVNDALEILGAEAASDGPETLLLRMDAFTKKKLTFEAKRTGQSMNQVVLELLKQKLNIVPMN